MTAGFAVETLRVHRHGLDTDGDGATELRFVRSDRPDRARSNRQFPFPFWPSADPLGMMPTAAQYTGWADELGGLADELIGGLPAVLTAWEAGPVVGGNLSIVVHRGVEAAADHVAAINLGLDGLAVECTRRAGVCEDYTAALATYDVARARYLDELDAYNPYADGTSYFVPPPVPPTRPVRPASWADAG